jgi:1,4-dihydroxy-6-naphthoate synthase
MDLSIGFSTCPNDTFIFDAMVHGRIDCRGLTFVPQLADVEALNRMALEGRLDITKLSYAAYAQVSHRYQLLNAGSALGRGCGPLLISRGPIPMDKVSGLRLAIPGRMTTANLLLSHAFPQATDRVEMVFSAIEDAVLHGEVDAGVIIHESRFTYAAKGLHCLMDLGAHWELTTGQPIPLGGIAIRRNLPTEAKSSVDALVRQSVEHAFAHPDASHAYIMAHAQEMSPDVARQHIQLYVNQYSVDLGPEGRAAVRHLYAQAALTVQEPVFVG